MEATEFQIEEAVNCFSHALNSIDTKPEIEPRCRTELKAVSLVEDHEPCSSHHHPNSRQHDHLHLHNPCLLIGKRKRGKDLEEEKVKKLDLRCAPSRLSEKLKMIERKPMHMKTLESTPFRDFIKIPKYNCKRSLITALLTKWDHEEKCFSLGGQKVFLQPKDVALILGLPMRGDLINLTDSERECYLKKKYFTMHSPTMQTLEMHIDYLLAEDSEEALSDFRKLFVLYICSTLLFPRSNYTFPSSLISVADDCESLHKYAWAVLVHDFLIKAMCEVKRKGGSYMAGCALVLQLWYYEHTRQYQPAANDLYPRFLRWSEVDQQARKQTQTYVKEINELKWKDVIVEIIHSSSEDHLLPVVQLSAENVLLVEAIGAMVRGKVTDQNASLVFGEEYIHYVLLKKEKEDLEEKYHDALRRIAVLEKRVIELEKGNGECIRDNSHFIPW